MSRQKGFEAYFYAQFGGQSNVYIYDIEDTSESDVNDSLSRIFLSHANLDGVFVTNSRVFKIARFLKASNNKQLRLIGYDLIGENIEYLEDGTVDFLISQKPFDQGFIGIRALFNLVILRKPVQREYNLPIEILTKENYQYHNLDVLNDEHKKS